MIGEVSKILLEVKADVKDAKDKLKDLSGVEKKMAEDAIKASEARNQSIEKYIKGLGTLGLAMDTVGKVQAMLSEAMRSYGEHARLAMASAGANIESLSGAFSGLLNQHDLLTFAAQTMNGAFKLNQQEMETVGKAAVALHNRGFDLTEALKKLTDAAVKGKAEGLDDLGLSMKEGATKAETLTNFMGELNKVIADSGDEMDNAADDVQRLAVAWDNATDAIKQYGAEFTMSLAEGVLSDKVQGQLKQAIELAQKTGMSLEDAVSRVGAMAREDYSRAQANRANRQQAGRQVARADNSDIEMPDMDIGAALKAKRDKADAAFKQLADERKRLANEVAKSTTDDLVTALEAEIEATSTQQGFDDVHAALMDSLSKSMNEQSSIDFSGMIQKTSEAADKANAALYEKFNAQRSETFLESVFGTIEEFNVYQAAFQGLTDAVGSSYDAIITGSESGTKAFKKSIADSLMAIGKQEAVMAIKETAYAVGDLAMGNLAGAAAHGKSAALHAAAAVAAGAAAHSIGTSAQVAAADKAAADKEKADEQAKKDAGKSKSGGGSSGGSGSNGERPIIVMLGSGFDETTPRQRAARSREAVDRALRERDDA